VSFQICHKRLRRNGDIVIPVENSRARKNVGKDSVIPKRPGGIAEHIERGVFVIANSFGKNKKEGCYQANYN